METNKSKPELLVIVGPTASGKSALAMRLAKDYAGEIIAADSRTVYKGMDIGTAKPTPADQRAVPHWGLDLVSPGEQFSAARFKAYAESKITNIQARQRLPLLVGGTGLYIDSVIFNFSFTNSTPQSDLAGLSLAQLKELIKQRGYALPENFNNRRHLTRTLERAGRSGSRRRRPLAGCLLVGLMPSDKKLQTAISDRADQMFKDGILLETQMLVKRYGREAVRAMGGIVYQICLDVLDHKYETNEAIELFKKADWQYARRQRTWFRRNKFIQWFSDVEAAHTSVTALLNN